MKRRIKEINESKTITNAIEFSDLKSTKGIRVNGESSKARFSLELLMFNFTHILKDMFLPRGYPYSVSGDYMGYQIWDSAQALCSSVTGVLSTRAILKGYGVGNVLANATSATLQWVIRDGSGMIGRILFAWKKGTELDCNAKTWRYMADILNDIGMALEMISPHTSLFLAVSSAGVVAKSICGVAGGCTKASLTQHFSQRDNLADVSAKDSSQETAIGLMGLFVGIFVSTWVPEDSVITMATFILFTILHLYCNYRAVSNVQLNIINRYRAQLLYKQYRSSSQISSPKEISKIENILFRDREMNILLGESLTQIKSDSPYSLVEENDHYEIWHSQEKNQVFILIEINATSEDIITSYFKSIHYLTSSTTDLPQTFFESLENQGWILQRHLLNPSSWRYQNND